MALLAAGFIKQDSHLFSYLFSYLECRAILVALQKNLPRVFFGFGWTLHIPKSDHLLLLLSPTSSCFSGFCFILANTWLGCSSFQTSFMFPNRTMGEKNLQIVSCTLIKTIGSMKLLLSNIPLLFMNFIFILKPLWQSKPGICAELPSAQLLSYLYNPLFSYFSNTCHTRITNKYVIIMRWILLQRLKTFSGSQVLP